MTAAPKKKKHILRKILLTLLLLLILVPVCALGYTSVKAQYTTTYQGYTARSGNLTTELSFDSTISLVDSQTITASEAGKVRSIQKQPGEQVKKGDVILTLSSGERIKAEVDGRVNTLAYGVGESFSAGATLGTVADFTHVAVKFNANEYTIAKLSRGMSCTVKVTANSKTYTSQLSSISYTGNTSRNITSYTCTVYLDVDEDILPGMKVSVVFRETLAENAVIVSRSSLSFDDMNQAFVYLQAEDGSITTNPVTLGELTDDDAQILSGLKSSDVYYAKVEKKTTTAGLFAQMMQSAQQNSSNSRSGSRSGSGNWGGSSGSFNGGSFNGGSRPQ